MAGWQSGYAAACKAVYAGSIPASASNDMIKAIIFDRDGTLIKHVPYLSDPNKVKLLPFVNSTISLLINQDLLLFLHTNQSGIEKGLFSIKEAQDCNTRMLDLMDIQNNPFSKICIAHSAKGDCSEYRKPSPVFGLELMHDYRLQPQEICYVGDSIVDAQTANALSCKFIGIQTGPEELSKKILNLCNIKDFTVLPDLSQLPEILLSK